MQVFKGLSRLLANTSGALNPKLIVFTALVALMVLAGLWVMGGWAAQIDTEPSGMVAPLR